MKKLFLEQFKLNFPVALFFFPLFGFFAFIPNYPLIVAPGYSILGVMVYVQAVKANSSIEFSAMLPVRRRDISGAICLASASIQLAILLVAVPFAFWARAVMPEGNIVGIDANFSFFAYSLLCYSAFNLVFMPAYFKTGYKFGIPLVLGLITFIAVYGIIELTVQLTPALYSVLDGFALSGIYARLAFLLVAATVYAGTLALSVKLAGDKFEKANL